jgi:hypothetical protein
VIFFSPSCSSSSAIAPATTVSPPPQPDCLTPGPLSVALTSGGVFVTVLSSHGGFTAIVCNAVVVFACRCMAPLLPPRGRRTTLR